MTPTTDKTEATKPTKPAAIDTMEGFHESIAEFEIAQMTGHGQPVVVTPKIYRLITKNDIKSPLFWFRNVPVIDESRAGDAMDVYTSSKKINEVIIR